MAGLVVAVVDRFAEHAPALASTRTLEGRL